MADSGSSSVSCLGIVFGQENGVAQASESIINALGNVIFIEEQLSIGFTSKIGVVDTIGFTSNINKREPIVFRALLTG